MALVFDECFLPVRLTAPPLTDDEFAAFRADHSEYLIEMTAEGENLMAPPNPEPEAGKYSANPGTVAGEGPGKGFGLDVPPVWDPLES